MLDYLKMFEQSANLVPGFEAEVQDLFRKVEPNGFLHLCDAGITTPG